MISNFSVKYAQKVEFDKILDQLSTFCDSKKAKERVFSVTPFVSKNELFRSQAEVQAAFDLIIKFNRPSFESILDVENAFKRAKLEAILSMEELLQIARTWFAIKRIKEYGAHIEDNQNPLYDYFYSLNPQDGIAREIDRCILSSDEMSDNASPKLHSIRRDIHNQEEKIRQELQRFTHNQNYKDMLQDSVVTIRDNRFCIPVKAEHKNSFPGMIHDQSGTGSTLFIEPVSVVDANNKIHELRMQEQAEIIEILRNLSISVGTHTTEALADLELSYTLDFIFSKARYGFSLDAFFPSISDSQFVYLPKARHPLLSKEKVVPITLSIGHFNGEGYNSLIITGPNTGGKTVSLKTLGLLTWMAQCGFMIPTSEGAVISLFDAIYADIGDEQSIEQSLSTFSAHMVNIVDILKWSTNKSLVLLDELGAGTDPTEGAALAEAILEKLRNNGTLTAATTHYSELKLYALSTDDVENACCEFNVDTLSPTYRLLIGIPGKSNAFAISERLGLSKQIIQSAASLLESSDIRFEDVMTDLEDKKIKAYQEEQEAKRLRLDVEKLHAEYDEMNSALEARQTQILEKARKEAKEYLSSAKAEADHILARINKLIQNGGAIDVRALEKERTNLRELVNDDQSSLISLEIQNKKNKANSHNSFEKGDEVQLEGFDALFTIIDGPNTKGLYTVQAGALKMQAEASRMVKPKSNSKPIPSGTQAGAFGKSYTISSEMDMRGLNGDEACFMLSKYLDDAQLAGLEHVSVIHGKGSGALRTQIHQFLRRDSHVKSFRLGEYGEGDAGVTIIELKR